MWFTLASHGVGRAAFIDGGALAATLQSLDDASTVVREHCLGCLQRVVAVSADSVLRANPAVVALLSERLAREHSHVALERACAALSVLVDKSPSVSGLS